MEEINTEHETVAGPIPRPRRRWLRRLLLVLGPLVLALGAAFFYVTSGRYVVTENAYVKAEKIAISADVSGRIKEIGAKENDVVQGTQLLFRIDEQPFRIALARTEARLGIVVNEIEGLRTAYRQELVELEMAKDNLAFFEREYQRQRQLSRGGVVSKAQHDEARHEVQLARQRITAAHEGITRALTQLGGDPMLATEKHPRYRQAVAERDQALLDLKRTSVLSPAAGVVSNLQLQVGEYVESGEPIFSVVSATAPWITANLKETEMTHVRVGQAAAIQADAYPDRRWLATVASISPATGAEFSLLPPQNASGNWVKVVQRIPVRLRLVDPIGDPPLRAGMSVRVEIDTGRQRRLPEPLQSALGWVMLDYLLAESR